MTTIELPELNVDPSRFTSEAKQKENVPDVVQVKIKSASRKCGVLVAFMLEMVIELLATPIVV